MASGPENGVSEGDRLAYRLRHGRLGRDECTRRGGRGPGTRRPGCEGIRAMALEVGGTTGGRAGHRRRRQRRSRPPVAGLPGRGPGAAGGLPAPRFLLLRPTTRCCRASRTGGSRCASSPFSAEATDWTAVSGVAASSVTRLLGPGIEVNVLPNGLDLAAWTRSAPTTRSTDEVVVAWVGRVTGRERHPTRPARPGTTLAGLAGRSRRSQRHDARPPRASGRGARRRLPQPG